MILYKVGKLAPNPTHSIKGLVKYVPGRGYFRAVPSQNGDKSVTSPPPQSLNGSRGEPTDLIDWLVVLREEVSRKHGKIHRKLAEYKQVS